MKKDRLILFLISACIFFAGCSPQKQAVSDEPLCLPNTPPLELMGTAQVVLTKMHFEVEKYDTDALYIRTRPLSGAQFFELWKQDNASASSAVESNLYSLRRIVELECIQENSETRMKCTVQVLRLSMPEKPIEGAGRMPRMHTESTSSYQTLEVGRQKGTQVEWIDAGRDYDLERKILGRIQKRIEKGTVQ
jgi:hypothetical protein